MKKEQIIKYLQANELTLPPLDILDIEVSITPFQMDQADATIDLGWASCRFRFAAVVKADAKPQTLQLAVVQAKAAAASGGDLWPLVLVPFLSEEKLNQLLKAGVNAIDLCGNGALKMPGKLFVFRTGKPNLYREKSPIQSAYRGDSSLVARSLLLQPQFGGVSEIRAFIQSRHGTLAMGTISKAIKRLEEDLIVDRPAKRAVRLIDPSRLLDQLASEYRPAKTVSNWLGKINLVQDQFVQQWVAKNLNANICMVQTGASSVSAYATFAKEPVIKCYCNVAPSEVLRGFHAKAEETNRFPNLQLIQTDDQRVYFDARPNLVASPLQTWMELTHGDKRQKQAATQVRQGILQALETKRD